MASCDMCGRQGSLVAAEVEGIGMSVCQACSKFGVVRKRADEVPVPQKKMHREPALRITENYASLLRKAREKKGLTQEDFAKYLQERESVVAKWEQGRMRPSVDVARRLEKLLGVSLVVEEVEQTFVKEKTRTEGFTLGDFVKIRKK